MYRNIIKRALDFLIACAACIVLLPVCLIIALIIIVSLPISLLI